MRAAWLASFDARLSRFRADSELCALNRDRRSAVPASALLRAAVRAGLWAAERTGGLVDPTVLAALRRAGYSASLAGIAPAGLAPALVAAPPRRRRAPASGGAVASSARRRPGSRGAPTARHRVRHRRQRQGLGRRRRSAPAPRPRTVRGRLRRATCASAATARGARRTRSRSPIRFGGEPVHRLWLGWGAVATSGMDSALWRAPDGAFAHHLIDPLPAGPRGRACCRVTALAPSALEAETLAKAALLQGQRARRHAARREAACSSTTTATSNPSGRCTSAAPRGQAA